MMAEKSFRQEIAGNRILIAFIAIWALEAGMNTLYGFRRGGGGVAALGYASTFLAIAFVAAWLPTRLLHVQGSDMVAWAKRGAFLALTLLCVALSQIAGWSVMGVTLADGAAVRENAATKRSTAKERLDQLRAEKKSLGVQPAPDQIEARIDAEMSTVIRRTGETIKDATRSCADISMAPGVCLRVKKLQTDLASSKRAAELDRQIEAAGGRLDTLPAVAEGSPDVLVLARILGIGEGEVRFWFTVALVAIIGLFANLGFAIAGLGRPQALPSSGFGGSPGSNWGGAVALLPPPPPIFPAAPAASGGHPPQGGGPGAPITINLGVSGAHGAPSHGPATGAGTPPPASLGSQPEAPQPRVMVETPPPSNNIIHLPASPAPAVPVDRDPVRQMMDDLLVFKAHAVANQPGAATGADQMYERYRAFAGAKAIERPAFDTMFPALTAVKRVEFGGVPHYADVALKAVGQLQAVR